MTNKKEKDIEDVIFIQIVKNILPQVKINKER